MSEKPSIPFAETVALLLKNAGVNADEQLSRTLAMAIAIKFQETQAERDEAIWQQAAERIRAAAMEEAARGHDALADALVEYRGGFTAHSPIWKEADLLASSHLQSAAAIRALAPTPPGMVCVPMDSIPQIAADAMLAAAPGVKE